MGATRAPSLGRVKSVPPALAHSSSSSSERKAVRFRAKVAARCLCLTLTATTRNFEATMMNVDTGCRRLHGPHNPLKNTAQSAIQKDPADHLTRGVPNPSERKTTFDTW